MIELQTAVASMMAFLLGGGAEGIKELLTGMVVKGADEASTLWQEVFRKRPESKPLVQRLAQDPQDPSAQADLRRVLEDVLGQHRELQRRAANIKVSGSGKTIIAESGSVAADEISGSTITINNK